MNGLVSKVRAHYKWVVAAACFLMVFVCLGFCSSNKSMYVAAITEATGISRSLFSLNDTVRFVVCAVINVFFGSLVAKFGPKKLIFAGFVCLIGAMSAYALAENVLVFYLGGALLGVGASFTTTATVGCIVNKWFKQHRGTVMGAILAANGLGGAVAAQIVYPIIYQENAPFGYRNAYKLVILILAVTAAIVLLLIKEQPHGEAKLPTVVARKTPRSNTWAGVDYSIAKKQTFFYAVMVCVFFTGFMLQSVQGVAAAHMKDVQLDAAYIATVLSIGSVALTGSKFLTGVLYDKFGLRVTTMVCSVSGVIAMTSLVLLGNDAMGNTMAVVYPVISALALPLETVMLPLYAGDLFGEKSYSKMVGIFIAVNYAGFALGSPVINAVYDIFHSYTPAFVFCALLMVVVTVVMQFAITKAHKFRDQIMQ